MKFEEAMKLLNEGKKIRKSSWIKGAYIFINLKGDLVDESGRHYEIDLSNTHHLEDDNWEICKEKELGQFNEIYKKGYLSNTFLDQ